MEETPDLSLLPHKPSCSLNLSLLLILSKSCSHSSSSFSFPYFSQNSWYSNSLCLLVHFFHVFLSPSLTANSLSHSHLIIPPSQQSFLYPSPPFPPLLSQGANSLLLCSWRTAGNNGGVGLVVVATGMRQEREGGRQRRKAERERAGAEGMLVVSRAAGKRALANYTRFYAHRN